MGRSLPIMKDRRKPAWPLGAIVAEQMDRLEGRRGKTPPAQAGTNTFLRNWRGRVERRGGAENQRLAELEATLPGVILRDATFPDDRNELEDRRPTPSNGGGTDPAYSKCKGTKPRRIAI